MFNYSQLKLGLVVALTGVLAMFVGAPPCCAQALQSSTDISDPKQYGYFPDTKLALGVGFNPEDLSDPKLPCIVFKERPFSPAAQGTAFTAHYVRDTSELLSATNLDIKASADIMGGSASAHFNVNSEGTFDQDSITVVVKAVTDFGWTGMDASSEPHLTSSAEKLIDQKHFKAFAERCGSRYVALDHRVSSAGVIISISSVKQSWKQEFEAEASGSYGGSGMSASASVKFASKLKEAVSKGDMSFQVVATGGKGFGSLGEVMKGLSAQPDALQAIYAGLGKFLQDFGKENAALYSFSVGTMEKFGWDPSSELSWTDAQETQLQAIALRYRETNEAINHAENFLTGGPWRQAQNVLSPVRYNSDDDYRTVVTDAKEYQKTISKAFEDCKKISDVRRCQAHQLSHRGSRCLLRHSQHLRSRKFNSSSTHGPREKVENP